MFMIVSTVKIITSCFDMPAISVIVCTDSYSLYKCLSKLSTTKEKRLMIDTMALHQSYKRYEIYKIWWIHRDDNLVDAFTKATPNKALHKLIDTNRLTVRVEGFVKRNRNE
jgi:hypothetical protein